MKSICFLKYYGAILLVVGLTVQPAKALLVAPVPGGVLGTALLQTANWMTDLYLSGRLEPRQGASIHSKGKQTSPNSYHDFENGEDYRRQLQAIHQMGLNAEALVKAGNIQEGLWTYQKLWARNMQSPYTALTIAHLLTQMNRHEEAIFYYRHALREELHPHWGSNVRTDGNPEELVAYAQTCEQLEQWNEAEACYAQIKMLFVNHPDADDHCGGIDESCIKSTADEIAAVYWHLGTIAWQRKKDFKAISYYRQAYSRTLSPAVRASCTHSIEFVEMVMRHRTFEAVKQITTPNPDTAQP